MHHRTCILHLWFDATSHTNLNTLHVYHTMNKIHKHIGICGLSITLRQITHCCYILTNGQYTLITSDNQPNHTWLNGLGWDFTGLFQGHGKVISRSRQCQINAKQVKLLVFVVFSTLMFSLDVYDCLKHAYTPTQNIPKHLNRSEDNNKGVRRVIPRQIPLVSPLSDIAEIDQI